MVRFRSPLLVIVATFTVGIGVFLLLVPIQSVPAQSAILSNGQQLGFELPNTLLWQPIPEEVAVTWGVPPPPCHGELCVEPALGQAWSLTVFDCGASACQNGSTPSTVESTPFQYNGMTGFEGARGTYYAVAVEQAGNQSFPGWGTPIPVSVAVNTTVAGGWAGVAALIVGGPALVYATWFNREPPVPNRGF